jgi:hypothetical protein
MRPTRLPEWEIRSVIDYLRRSNRGQFEDPCVAAHLVGSVSVMVNVDPDTRTGVRADVILNIEQFPAAIIPEAGLSPTRTPHGETEFH